MIKSVLISLVVAAFLCGLVSCQTRCDSNAQCNYECPNANMAVCNIKGYCDCSYNAIVGKRHARALRATHCSSDDECTNACANGFEAYCNMASSDSGHWTCDCRHHG